MQEELSWHDCVSNARHNNIGKIRKSAALPTKVKVIASVAICRRAGIDFGEWRVIKMAAQCPYGI